MPIDQLLEIMEKLRDPDRGCPWDKQQTFRTIVPYTIEEAYEVADAIERDDMDELRDELGDLLFQVVFYAQMAREENAFDFADVVRSINEKMLRRHPHVFSDAEISGVAEQNHAWERLKADERKLKAGEGGHGQLDGVAKALPALLRAEKLQKRAAKVGFDWPDIKGVVAKIQEELTEVTEAVESAEDPARVSEEIGDLFFSCVNLSRHLKVNAETALRDANGKFERRFRVMESAIRTKGVSLADTTLTEMDVIWDQIKQKEK